VSGTADAVPLSSSTLQRPLSGINNLLRKSDRILYLDCPHWIDVRLDKDSGAEFREGELVCSRHGATFPLDSGECTYRPCEGATLEEVDVAVDDDGVYLAEDDYEFAHLGPKSDRDLSSGRIGFSGN
jgi:nitrite reductase/ring-hydroxylating ferredoxin subunit